MSPDNRLIRHNFFSHHHRKRLTFRLLFILNIIRKNSGKKEKIKSVLGKEALNLAIAQQQGPPQSCGSGRSTGLPLLSQLFSLERAICLKLYEGKALFVASQRL